MEGFLRLVGPTRAVEIFGVRLVGVNAENGKKLLLTLAFVAVVVILARLMRGLGTWLLRERRDRRVAFWFRQAVHLATAVVLLVGFTSIWFDDPTRLATALGLVTAGLAFALQKVVTALAGYFVILRGKTFNVGDRISMGGVRGDVITLGFLQTAIMEMGQPPPVQAADPAMWVRSRQYTGRVVTVSNARIFDEPVYNYSRELPYLWEEIVLPVPYTADRDRAERILLEAAERHTVPVGELSREVLEEMRRRYGIHVADTKPRVYFRLTDNWLELTVRFVVPDHRIREVKDVMTREILQGLDEAGIGVASATFEIVGLPPFRLQGDGPPRRRGGRREGEVE